MYLTNLNDYVNHFFLKNEFMNLSMKYIWYQYDIFHAFLDYILKLCFKLMPIEYKPMLYFTSKVQVYKSQGPYICKYKLPLKDTVKIAV